MSTGQIERTNIDDSDSTTVRGARWGGEIDTLIRLVQPVFVTGRQGGFDQLPYHQVLWQYFTLQDAIDFAIYAVRSTIDSLRFQPRPKTVGGPIDVLVIKPDEAFWVQKKEIRGELGHS